MDTTQIWTNIVAYVLQIGLLVGIGAALPSLTRLKVAAARLLYWQVLLVACLALPWVRPWHSEVIAVTTAPIAAVDLAPHIAMGTTSQSSMPSIAMIALWLLFAGMAIRLIWLATGVLKLARYRRHGCEIRLPPEWAGIVGHAKLLISQEVPGPVTFGFFQPVVLLPANFLSMPEAMRDAILFHELLHVERRDWLFTLGEELMRTVFWFHPAIWWVLGEIQLAREQTVDQAVIGMTQARDPYVDTLLAMAGVATELDLAPAPLFLRRRHLKQRVMGIVQEVRMSKTRLILAQATALATMAVACWFITGAIPLHAQSQIVTDGAGVTVNLNGSQLMHRSSVAYPVEALAKGVEGTVVVQVRLDANGEVIDDAIMSGPDELRKGVQQSVLAWHFDKSAGSSTRVVNIDFVKPAAAIPAAVMPVRPQIVINTPMSVPGGRGGVATQSGQTQHPLDQLAMPRKIDNIIVNGLSDSARDQLLAKLPVHVGDAYSVDTMRQVQEVSREFDEHLMVSGSGPASGPSAGSWTVRIEPETREGVASFTPRPVAAASIPAGAVEVAGNVQATNLINATKPIYPPLAKMARQQGTVKFDATVAKDGTMEDLKVVSGPPLLIPAAMQAVKQWVYKPTLVNGAPVEVVTTIDVNFSLGDGAFPPPALTPQ